MGRDLETAPLTFGVPNPAFDMHPVARRDVLLNLIEECGEVALAGDGCPATVVDQLIVIP